MKKPKPLKGFISLIIISHKTFKATAAANTSSSSGSKMLLQSSSISSPLLHPPSSSIYFYSQTQLGFYRPVLIRTNRHPITCCKFSSQVHNYGTVDFERKPPLNWKELYRRISITGKHSNEVAAVLNQWELEGKRPTKWELCRCIKDLRKFGRPKLALQIYKWMKNQGDRYRWSASDTAIELDLIAKAYGTYSAEEYFLDLPGSAKDNRAYGALLNAYARALMREKAESLFEKMKQKGYTSHPLSYNVLMTLYLKLKDYEKVMALITELVTRNAKLDLYTYNIWITACGSLGSAEKMEQVLERMKQDTYMNPNWTTYTTMASMYLRLGDKEKAKDCLKKIEDQATARDRSPFHYLLSLYSSLGEKEEVYRIWSFCKLNLPNILNVGYNVMIASLLRLDDMEGAEKIYEEWLLVRTSDDPKISNLLIGDYVRKGLLNKAEGFVKQVLEVGGKVNANTWEILARGHIEKKQIPEALSCMIEATKAEGAAAHWKPHPRTVSAFISVCKKESDLKSMNLLLEVLSKVKRFDCEKYMSLVSTANGDETDFDSKLSMDRDGVDGDSDDNGTNMLLGQLQESL